MGPRAWTATIAVACSLGFGACGAAERAPGPAGASPPASPQAAATPAAVPIAKPYAKDYQFSADWFTMRIPAWERILAPLKGQPGIRYLEIGVYEGRSALWILENVLSHPSARMTGIDIFPPGIRERYESNVKLSGHADKVTTIVGRSQDEVRKLPAASFDLVYVDGSRAADDVLADAVQSWAVLKPDGILIFNDYAWLGLGALLPVELRPKLAIDAFLYSYRYSLEVLQYDYQVIVRKTRNPCARQPDPKIAKYSCSPFGQGVYDWQARALRRPDGSVVALSAEERSLLEAFQRGTSYEFRTDAEHVQTRPDLPILLKRLEAEGALTARN